MFNKIIGFTTLTPVSNVKKSEKQFQNTGLQADTFERRTSYQANSAKNVTFTGEAERQLGKKILEAKKSLKEAGVTSPKEAYRISQSKEYIQLGLAAAGVVGGVVLANIAMAAVIAKTSEVSYDKLFPDKDGHQGISMSVDTNNQTVSCKDFNFHADAQNGIISKPDAGIDIRPERFTEIDKEQGIYRNAEKGIDIDLLHNKYVDPENGINIDLSKNTAEIQASSGHMVHINPDLITASPSFEGVHQHGTSDVCLPGHGEIINESPLDFFKDMMHSEKSDYVLDNNGHIHQGSTIPDYDHHPIIQLEPHFDADTFAAFTHPIDHHSDAFDHHNDLTLDAYDFI